MLFQRLTELFKRAASWLLFLLLLMKKTMNNLIIRNAVAGDLDHLPALLYELDKFHYSSKPEKYRSPEEMNQKRIEKNIFSLYQEEKIQLFMAFQNEKAIGMVSGTVKTHESITSKPRVVGFVNELVVLPEFRGTELATLLMDAIEQYFTDNGAVEFGLNVASFNERAVGFYAKKGYRPEALLLTKSISK